MKEKENKKLKKQVEFNKKMSYGWKIEGRKRKKKKPKGRKLVVEIKK